MAADVVRVGLVGSAFGTRVHLPGFLANPEYRIVAICSAQQARAEAAAKEFDIPVALDDYHRLVGLDEVDLVDVCTPPPLHAPVTMAALQAGKPVLCEKPFALTLNDAVAMAEGAKQRDVVNAVVHEMRYLPVRRHLRDLVRSGYLGQLRFVTATVFADYATNPAMEPYWYTWVAQKEQGGGALNGLMSHHLDLFRYTFGDLDQVAGRATTMITEKPMLGWDYRDGDPIGAETPVAGTHPADADDAVLISGTLAGGAPFSIAGSWAVYHGSGVRVEAYGSEGTLVLDATGRVLGAQVGDGGLSEIPVPDSYALPNTGGHPMVAPFAALAADMAASLLGRPRPDPLFATFDDGVQVQQITENTLGPIAGPGVR